MILAATDTILGYEPLTFLVIVLIILILAFVVIRLLKQL